MTTDKTPPTGRFAPSPTGRMHLGNVFTALLSWLSVRSRGGRWILRIEDLDPQRSKRRWSELIEDDLRWLGLEWDEGGLDDIGPHGPYSQSRRGDFYAAALERLKATGLTYPCTCTRADIMSTQAPHQSDGRIIYGGRCRPASLPRPWTEPPQPAATRLWVPDQPDEFDDLIMGPQQVNLAESCGDFILRRADGAWAYQLAVVVDDDAMGITEIMRGNDLLLSVGQQNYLRRLLGMHPVEHAHLPLVCNSDGVRLSKRDSSLSMEALRQQYSSEELIGILGRLAGLNPSGRPTTAKKLAESFDLSRIPRVEKIIVS